MNILISNPSRRALTLLELAVVCAILVALTGMVLYSLTPDRIQFSGAGQNKTAPQIATEATMMGIREAVMGGPAGPGYWDDVGHLGVFWPSPDLYFLFKPFTSVPSPLIIGDLGNYQEVIKYNPQTRLGWRGPYMQPPTASYPTNALAITKGFTSRYYYSSGGTPFFLDAWGNPIVLQFPENYTADGVTFVPFNFNNPVHNLYRIENCRLVSAGPNGTLDTEVTFGSLANGMPGYEYLAAHPGSMGDDIILFFMKYPGFGPNSP